MQESDQPHIFVYKIIVRVKSQDEIDRGLESFHGITEALRHVRHVAQFHLDAGQWLQPIHEHQVAFGTVGGSEEKWLHAFGQCGDDLR